MKNKDQTTHQRIVAVALSVCLFVTLALSAGFYRVISLKVNTPEKLTSVAMPTNSKIIQLATRGALLDRRGRILAGSRIGYKLFVDPSEVENIEELAFELGEKLKLPPATIERKILERKNSQYVVIVNLLEQWQVELMRSSSYKSVGLEQRLVRSYPHGNSIASLIGLVGTEHIGLAGLEHALNHSLDGESGTLVRLRDAKKKQTLWVDPEDYYPKTDGKDVQLTIDVVIQEIATNHLRKEVLRCNAGGGRVVVLDPKTGDILAMTDILNKRENWTQEIYDPMREIDPRLGRNRCLSDPYEPGSTFKPFVWSIATELSKASVDELLPTPTGSPHKTSSGRIIRDAHYYGPSTWSKVLIKSMNSGMAIVAERLSNDEMRDGIIGFGFGTPTHLGLAGETSGIMTTSKNWSAYTQTSVAMGHEIAVTPVQMVQGFCAFARDGSFPQLRLIAKTEHSVPIVKQAITPEIARTTRSIMGLVMTEGTGRNSKSELYDLFGKSGTAQLPRADGKGYFEDRYTASFVAGAPLENPAVVVICVIDDPDKKIAHYGGEVAGPVVRDIIDDTLEYLGVLPTKFQLTQVPGL